MATTNTHQQKQERFARYLARFAAALDGERLDEGGCVVCGWALQEIVGDPGAHRAAHVERAITERVAL